MTDFRCLRCDRTLPESQRNPEHVYPHAIGGSLVLHEVCKPCNDQLGQHFDAPLVDNLFIRMKRHRLGIANRDGKVPDPLGETVATLADQPQIRVELDRGSGVRTLPSEIRSTDSNGNERRTIFLDSRDQEEVRRVQSKVEERAARRGQRAIVEVEEEIRTENPKIQYQFNLPIHDWMFGLFKIAYELAFFALGSPYLDDPMAAKFRSFLQTVPPSKDTLDRSGILDHGKARVYGPGLGKMPPREGFPENFHWGEIVLDEKANRLWAELWVFEAHGLATIVSESASAYPAASVRTAVALDAQQRRHSAMAQSTKVRRRFCSRSRGAAHPKQCSASAQMNRTMTLPAHCALSCFTM